MPSLPVRLQQDEQVLQRLRRHPIFLIQQLVGVWGLAGVLIVAVNLLNFAVSAWGLTLLRSLAVVVAGFFATYYLWYGYSHTEWIVTNQRLLDYNKRHWFHEQMTTADLVNVEDISVEQRGVLATLANYGNVLCQTAGSQPNLVMDGLADPKHVLSLVDAARDQARRDMYQRQQQAYPAASYPAGAPTYPPGQYPPR